MNVQVIHSEKCQRSFYKAPNISWSEDNVIAIPAVEGIHIHEPTFDKTGNSGNVTYVRKFTKAPEESNAFNVEVDRRFLNSHLPVERIGTLMLDRTLSPLANSKPSYKGFCLVKWSPRGIGAHKSCVLATLTADHRLSLYTFRNRCWTILVELSKLYYEYTKGNFSKYVCDEKLNNQENAAEMLRRFSSDVYSLSAVQIEWTHKFWFDNGNGLKDVGVKGNCNCGCFLIVAMKDGSLVFWFTQSPAVDMGLKIWGTGRTDLGNISSMNWQKTGERGGLLAVGSRDGRGKIYKIAIETTNMFVAFEEMHCIWEYADGMSLDSLCWNEVDTRVYYLFGCKNSFYFGWVVKDNAVTEFKYVPRESCLPLSGVCKALGGFLAAPMNGPINSVSFNTSPEFSITVETVNCPETKGNVNYGIGCSPSGAIYCLLHTVKASSYSFVFQDPISITYWTLLSPGDIRNILSKDIEDFSDKRDILICLCGLGHGESAKKSSEFWMDFILTRKHAEENTSKLMFYRWLLQFIIKPEHMSETSHSELVTELDNLLLFVNLSKFVTSREFLELQQTTDNAWKTRIGTICQYILRHCKSADRQISNETIERVEKILEQPFPRESCQICQDEVDLDDVHIAKCKNQHVVGRCCLTLVAHGIPYKKCSGCSATASVAAIDAVPAAECPYCGCGIR